MSKYLDPKILIAIKDLALAAKTTVDGFMTGMHRSNVKGTGIEFSQYRSYQPGDDLKWIDWKMYARSDRYYIRESEIETSISVRIVVDASASMKHRDHGYTKMDYAKYLAASLAYLANLQNDAIGLYTFQNNSLSSIPCKKDHQHLSRLFYQLEHIEPAGTFTRPEQYKDIFASQQKELLIFITDFYETNGEIMKLLTTLSSLKHELMVLHLIGDNELEMSYKGFTALEDYETGQIVRINTEQGVKEYKARLSKFLEDIRTNLLDKGIYYRLTKLSEPIDKALRDFLKQRAKLKV